MKTKPTVCTLTVLVNVPPPRKIVQSAHQRLYDKLYITTLKIPIYHRHIATTLCVFLNAYCTGTICQFGHCCKRSSTSRSLLPSTTTLRPRMLLGCFRCFVKQRLLEAWAAATISGFIAVQKRSLQCHSDVESNRHNSSIRKDRAKTKVFSR